MIPTIVSFYTPFNDGNYYAENAERLKAECAELGLETWIKKVEFRGRPWEKVLKEKPMVIMEALRQLGDKPALWIDVDGSILQQPTFILEQLAQDPGIDFMGVPKLPEKGRPFYMGCSFWGNTEFSKEFLRRWDMEYQKEDSEELAFGRAFNATKMVLNWKPLPKEYMRIDGKDPINKAAVVIHRLSHGDTKREFYARMGRKK